MNIIALTGNATKDIELSYSPQGTAFGKGTIAVRRDFKNKQTNEYETDFINFTAIGKTGEIMADHIKKGDKFGITGRLQIRTFEDESGKRQYFTEVIVNGFDFPSKGGNNQGDANTPNSNQNASSGQQRTDNDPFAGGGQIDISDDTLPF
jgi:single-strand DNA-binding protein